MIVLLNEKVIDSKKARIAILFQTIAIIIIIIVVVAKQQEAVWLTLWWNKDLLKFVADASFGELESFRLSSFTKTPCFEKERQKKIRGGGRERVGTRRKRREISNNWFLPASKIFNLIVNIFMVSEVRVEASSATQNIPSISAFSKS